MSLPRHWTLGMEKTVVRSEDSRAEGEPNLCPPKVPARSSTLRLCRGPRGCERSSTSVAGARPEHTNELKVEKEGGGEGG